MRLIPCDRQLLALLCWLWLWAPPSLGGAEPALLLANLYRPGIDLERYLVSEKLDGVRARWDGKNLISRGGNTFDAPAAFTRGFPTEPLDGELWMGRGRFETVSGLVRRIDAPEAWREVRFMVFDLPGSAAPFHVRAESLKRIVAAAGNPHLQWVEQRRIADHGALMAELERVVAAGGEGLMLHRANALYRGGRSDDLLKLKPHDDAEAVVIAHLPGKGKYVGMLGSLLVETETGVRLRIGSGFTDAQRRKPPAVGSTITYRYRGFTHEGKPRFATFLRIREPF